MRVDEEKSRDARRRHALGTVELLNAFRASKQHLYAADLSGRWLTVFDRKTRRMIRARKAAMDPGYLKRRARRKAQHAARRRNR